LRSSTKVVEYTGFQYSQKVVRVAMAWSAFNAKMEMTHVLCHVRTPFRGVMLRDKGVLGCRRYHTHDTCIWQVDCLNQEGGVCYATA
jgi:hypothetical protein